MKAFWGVDKNIGDRLTPIILRGLTKHEPLYTDEHEEGKLWMVGSTLERVRPHDIVLGSGLNKEVRIGVPNVRYLAVRGKLTRELIDAKVPEVYGDPALLLPLIYRPHAEKRYKVGVIPHYLDKTLVDAMPGQRMLDIEAEWQQFIRELLACESVISSSLHGIVLAEAYGIPAVWAVYSHKIEGGEFKYQDYFSGTGRGLQQPFTLLPPIENLPDIQQGLRGALNQL